MGELQEQMDQLKIRIFVAPGEVVSLSGEDVELVPLKVCLLCGRKQSTLTFYESNVPYDCLSAEEIMESLLADAKTVEKAQSFGRWCSLYEMIPDAHAARLYTVCQRIAAKLRRFLGDEYPKFLSLIEL